MKDLTVKETAKAQRISERRVRAKIKQGHYPHAKQCPCGQAWLIPKKDIKAVEECLK